jgi:hypothetical protein
MTARQQPQKLRACLLTSCVLGESQVGHSGT